MSAEEPRLTRLVAVAEEGAEEDRRNLLLEIAGGFCAGNARFTASQLSHFAGVLEDAIGIADKDLRGALAARLAEAPAAPPGVIAALAEDDFAVAEPVLRASPALDEETLVRLVVRASQAHKKAIAARPRLTGAVVAELIAHADADALLALIENRETTIAAESMMRLVARARMLPALHEALLRRDDLTAAALTRLYFYVVSSLKRVILKRAENIDAARLLRAMGENRRRLIADVAGDKPDGERCTALARRLAGGAVSESLLNDLIENERVAEFVLAFSHFLAVDAAAGKEILEDHTWQALAVACRAMGLERSTFARIASSFLRSGDEHNKAVHMLDIYRRLPLEAAESIMRFWRVAAAREESAAPSVPAAAAMAFVS
jgi:uncharacterized protein (DUF2336 family)